jgi:hypothetical protein
MQTPKARAAEKAVRRIRVIKAQNLSPDGSGVISVADVRYRELQSLFPPIGRLLQEAGYLVNVAEVVGRFMFSYRVEEECPIRASSWR